jgi:hypothetical protein
MKKEFISPMIKISEFRKENVLTTSGITNVQAVEDDLKVSMSSAGSDQGTTKYELTW